MLLMHEICHTVAFLLGLNTVPRGGYHGLPVASTGDRGSLLAGLAGVGVGDADVLGVEVFLDAFEAAFASRAGLLDAAEGCGGVGDDAGVRAQHAGFKLFAYPDAAVQVLGEDVGHQPVFGVVGQPRGLVLGAEGDDRGNGAEDLLGKDAVGRWWCSSQFVSASAAS